MSGVLSMRHMLRLAAVVLCLAPPLQALPARADEPVVVFAAASLKSALDAAAAAFQAGGGAELKISYGGSLALARQIVAGAPADLFASADEASMDEASKGEAIKPESRIDLLGNQLVVVAPKQASSDALPLTPEAFDKAIGAGRLATGEVNTVPVGKYAREALRNLGLWSAVEPHLAMTDNVRAALAFVARGEAPLGIVYATDATADPTVKVVATFPEASHAPILYPFALTAASHNDGAAKFLAYLKSPAGRAIFERQGFRVLNGTDRSGSP
jgi:molybdate transport system substrate-binding protein